jgi:hypothetical protein
MHYLRIRVPGEDIVYLNNVIPGWNWHQSHTVLLSIDTIAHLRS